MATDQATDQAGGQDTDQAAARPDRTDELIASLRAEIDFLREESRRKDRIIAGLVQRVPALPAGQDAPETPPAAQGAAEPTAPAFRPSVAAWRERTTREVDLDRPSEPAWRRWWRRMTGG